MIRSATRARPSTLGALFAFLTAVVVTVFGAVPSSAAMTRQPGASSDTTAAVPGDADLGASVSIAVPDDTNQDLHVPGPVGAPAAELPDLPANSAATPATFASAFDSNRPDNPRGRAPPR
jgi:hypothetical protein